MSCENCDESAYVIDKLAKLLAEIAVIVNGPEPPLTSWSYHDLPEKVRALKAHLAPVAVPSRESVEKALEAAGASRKKASVWVVTTREVVEAVRAMLAAAERKGGA